MTAALALKALLVVSAVYIVWRLIDYTLAADVVPSIVDARVIRAVDGDTIEVNAVVWIDQHVTAMVRLRGIDAPEAGSHAKCPSERWAALQATEWLKAAIEGKDVTLTDIGVDKYGRTLGAVWLGERNIAEEMIMAKLVRPYDGGARKGWC